MECNFLGHTFSTRFLICTLRKRDYADLQSGTWKTLMETVAQDARYMWETGVQSGCNPRYWGIVVGIIGDWPFLHKCAGFERSFNNIQKKVRVRKAPVGICHLCQAGQVDCPFEQIETRRPIWASTEFVQDPFAQPSPFTTQLLCVPGEEAGLFQFDWFHTMSLGVLKHYLGSVIALMSDQEQQGSIDERFASLSEKYRRWCHQNSERAFVMRLTKESINWENRSTYPTGSLHRGALSTVLMKWVASRFASETFPNEPLLSLAADACAAIQRCTRIIYRSGLWLEAGQCRLVAELGFQFLRRYSQMATMAKNDQRCFFIYQPKIHSLHHFCMTLWKAHQRNTWAVNPLGFSCQQSEDFIGRPSRLARRVTPQTPVLRRIMERYLLRAYREFVRSRYLVRPGWDEYKHSEDLTTFNSLRSISHSFKATSSTLSIMPRIQGVTWSTVGEENHLLQQLWGAWLKVANPWNLMKWKTSGFPRKPRVSTLTLYF